MRGTAFMIVVSVAGWTACRTPSEAPRAPAVAEAPREAARLAAVSPVALAAAGSVIYYADLEGVWAVPVAGGDARLVTAPEKMVERILPRGDELVLGTADAVLAVPTAGGPNRVIHAGTADALAVDGDGVWFVEGDAVRVVPLAGGAPRTVAAGIGELVAPLVTDDDAVYAAIALDETAAVSRKADVRAAMIVRIAKRDGARTTLAKRQFGVEALVRRDDRLYWTSFAAGLRSIPAPGGGEIRTHLGGGGSALAEDADGIVVQTHSGLWIEVRPDGAHVAVGDARRQPEKTPGLVLAGGSIVALVTDHEAGASELWREPRPWHSSITVTGWVTDRLADLVAVPDGVIVLDALRDEDATGRIMHIDPRGRRKVLASAKAMSSLVVDGDRIAYRAGDAIWLTSGKAPAVRAVTVGKELVLGLTLAGERFFWSDSQGVRTAPVSGGAPTTFYDDPSTRHAGTGKPDAQLVVDGATVYFSQIGWSGEGVQRVVDATTLRAVYEPPEGVWTGEELVRLGDAVYTTTSEREIVRVPLDGGTARVVVSGLEYPPVHLAAGGDRLVTDYWSEAGQTVAVVDPVAGKLTPLVSFPADSALVPVLSPAGDAVYVGLAGSDLILRIPLPRSRR